MHILLDTLCLLWWMAADPRLGKHAKRCIQTPSNNLLVSAASVLEIEVKRTLGKLSAPDDLVEVISLCGFQLLPINAQHATLAGRLPRHHQDPFDRMLIGQAMAKAHP